MYHLLAFLTMSVWGTTFVATKLLLSAGLSPASIFLLRFSMAYAGLSLWCLARRKRKENWFCSSLRDEVLMAVAGMTGGSLYFLTENTALEMAMAGNVSLIVCLAPLITAVFARLAGTGEQTGPRLWAGSFIALTGVAFVVWGSMGGAAGTAHPLLGNLLALAAATVWAVYQMVVKPLGAKYGTLMLTRKVFGYGLLTIQPAVWLGRPVPWEVLARPAVWGNLLFLGLVASLLCYAVWNVVVGRLGSVISANYIYLNPLVTCIASYFVLGERLGLRMLIGGMAILLGLYIVAARRPSSV